MRLSTLTAVAACLPLLGGCITRMDSKPAGPASAGSLYALPVPVLQFTPQGDGSMAMEVLYLPDPNNTYAVEAETILGGYTFEVKTKGGLLESVTFDADSPGVAEQMLSSYGEIEAKKVEARLKAEEAEATAAKDKAKEAADQAKAIADAKAAVAMATAKRDKLVELGASKDAVIAAEVGVVDAQYKLAGLITQAETRAASGAMNKLEGGGNPEAAGPIFFRLAPNSKGSVDLIADHPQIRGETSKPPKAAPQPEPLTLSLVHPMIVRPSRDPLVKIRASRGFDDFWRKPGEESTLVARKTGATVLDWRPVKAVESGETYVYAIFSDDLAPGLYDLTLVVRQKAGDAEPVALNTITIDIRGRRR